MSRRTRARVTSRRKPGEKTKLEQAFEDEVLRPRFLTREILWYAYEPLKLKLARRTFYTPDFIALEGGPVDELVFYEVKGIWEDAARVKIKVAASTYHFFRFVAVTRQLKRDGGGWRYEEIDP